MGNESNKKVIKKETTLTSEIFEKKNWKKMSLSIKSIKNYLNQLRNFQKNFIFLDYYWNIKTKLKRLGMSLKTP